jgi:hypothetical protein
MSIPPAHFDNDSQHRRSYRQRSTQPTPQKETHMWLKTADIANDAFARVLRQQKPEHLAFYKTNRATLEPVVVHILRTMPDQMWHSLSPEQIEDPVVMGDAALHDAAQVARLLLAMRARNLADWMVEIRLGQTRDPDREYPKVAFLTMKLLSANLTWPFVD